MDHRNVLKHYCWMSYHNNDLVYGVLQWVYSFWLSVKKKKKTCCIKSLLMYSQKQISGYECRTLLIQTEHFPLLQLHFTGKTRVYHEAATRNSACFTSDLSTTRYRSFTLDNARQLTFLAFFWQRISLKCFREQWNKKEQLQRAAGDRRHTSDFSERWQTPFAAPCCFQTCAVRGIKSGRGC